jgi:PAS domain S-box-containing protein
MSMTPQLTVAQVFESLPDAVVCVDREARIVAVNAQAERMFGYQRDELLGQPLALLIPEDARWASASICAAGARTAPCSPRTSA